MFGASMAKACTSKNTGKKHLSNSIFYPKQNQKNRYVSLTNLDDTNNDNTEEIEN